MANDHIGTTGNSMYRGIPQTTIGWSAAAAHTLTVLNAADVSNEADVQMSKDNFGETIEMNRTNKRRKFKVTAKPVSTTRALALAIAADLPQKMDILTVFVPAGTDIVFAGIGTTSSTTDTYVCDSASARWSPEGELTVDIELTVWIGKVFAAFS